MGWPVRSSPTVAFMEVKRFSARPSQGRRLGVDRASEGEVGGNEGREVPGGVMAGIGGCWGMRTLASDMRCTRTIVRRKVFRVRKLSQYAGW